MIVKVIRSYDYPEFNRQSPANSGIWDGILFDESVEGNYDFLLCLNPPVVPITTHLPKERRWLITQEPPLQQFHLYKGSFKYFGKIFTQFESENNNVLNTQTCLPWHVNMTYDELVQLRIGKKQDKISTITSSYNYTKLHKIRLDFISYLKEENIKIDFFGKGVNFLEDKFEGLYPYKYSICIENSVFKHYWTEKLADCYLSFTMPIYYGCTNLEDYFPKESFIQIDLSDFCKSKQIIENAIIDRKWEKSIKKIITARDLILTKYQFFPYISELLKLSKLEWKKHDLNKKKYTIPSLASSKYNLVHKLKYYGRKIL